MFSVHGHASPAFFSILLVLHDEVTSKVLDTSAFTRDARVYDNKRRIVSKVEVLSVPSFGEVAVRSVTCNNNILVNNCEYLTKHFPDNVLIYLIQLQILWRIEAFTPYQLLCNLYYHVLQIEK